MAAFADGSDGIGGAVDVSSWSFYGRDEEEGGGPTPFLVGPIVGAVTEHKARVLVEVNETQVVTMDAVMDGEVVCSLEQEVLARTPTVFKIRHLAPAKRVSVVVVVGEQSREARFTTTSNKLNWKIATVSCNCHTHTEKLGLWHRLSRVAGELDCVLHLGDQIYGDSDFELKNGGGTESFDSAWQACLTILRPLHRREWMERKEELLECYRKTYRTTWNMPMTAKVLASTANYMICDDHEFTDDLGDEPEHSNPRTVEFFVARIGYQAYCEYQKQLLNDINVLDHRLKPYYAFRLSPRVGFFMTDNRIERSLHKDQGTEETWENQKFLGPSQWERLRQAFEVDFAECDVVLFGAPTPLVFISQNATWVAEKKIDDARGTWGHSDFKTEQKAVCKLLTDWQNGYMNRTCVVLGGDVHMGGFTDSWHEESEMPLHQMTASAVGNVPEGGMNAARELIIRSAMHADERMFEFKARHHEWIYGPNFGVVDFKLAKHGRRRPAVTLTLVPQTGSPKLRNLNLGDADVPIKKKDHSEASEAAYATASIMGVAPEGCA